VAWGLAVMSTLHSRIYGVVSVAVATGLAACAGGSTFRPPTQGGMPSLADSRISSVSPDAARKTLLYISDLSGYVYIYSYPDGRILGTLAGFDWPQGLCSDRSGDVWIADTNHSRMVEYAHGGTTKIRTLKDAGQLPTGCAVNPQTGDLAVTNSETVRLGSGSIAIYTRARGNPQIYFDSQPTLEYFDTYDGNTLYVDGTDANTGDLRLASFADKTFTDLTLTGATIRPPGSIGVDKGLWIEDEGSASRASVIYQLSVKGTVAKVTGTTPLSGAFNCIQSTVLDKTVICPDEYQSAVELYKYPTGGPPTKTIHYLYEPVGTAISK
jgi:hypothetical protein